jgi:hypothetical protein
LGGFRLHPAPANFRQSVCAIGTTVKLRLPEIALLCRCDRERSCVVALQEAVASLPEPYRETIVLRYFGELSIAEIASQTGRPIGTVKTHIGRGLLRLRPALAEVRLT